MTNTDSPSLMNEVAAISVRENERGTEIGNGWDPQWHQPTDVYATYNDKDFQRNGKRTQVNGLPILPSPAVRPWIHIGWNGR